MTRIDAMKAQGRERVLPFNPAPFLTDWLLEIGPTAPGGEAPIRFQDMAAWSHLIGIELSPWEARTLRRLSRVYVNQRDEARDPASIEPRLKVDEEARGKRMDDQFAAMVTAFKR